jgi:hypothetical protein
MWVQVRMVAALPLDELGRINFSWSCRVMNMAWIMLPPGIYHHIEMRALQDAGLHDIVEFAIRFEEVLFVYFGEYYDSIVQEVI